MNRFTRFALAACASFLAVPALAGDLPEPYVPAEPAPAAPVEGASGWYLRGDIGVGIIDHEEEEGLLTYISTSGGADLSSIETRGGFFEDTLIVGGGLGYRFNGWFRADLTAEYRASMMFEETLIDSRCPGYLYCGGDSGGNIEKGELTTIVTLVNAYADLGHYGGFTPFVGLGIGFAHHNLGSLTDVGWGYAVGGFGDAEAVSDFDFAWAAHAGLAYEVNDRLTLEASYRYLNMGDTPVATVHCNPGTSSGSNCYGAQVEDLTSHDVRLGMRWNFGGETAYAPEPVVAKY